MNTQSGAAEAKFRGLLEAAPDAIVIVDAHGHIVIVNSQAQRLFGYREADLLGRPIEFLLPERLRGLHVDHRADYTAHAATRPMGIGLDLTARRNDGREFPVEISLSPFQADEGLLIMAAIRDTTDRQMAAAQLEAQVQERTAHLNALLQFSQELLITRGLDAILTQALQRAMRLTPEAERGAIYLCDEGGDSLTLSVSIGFDPLPQVRIASDLGIIGLALSRRQTYQFSASDEYRSQALGLTREAWERMMQAFRLTRTPSGALAIPLMAHNQTVGVLMLQREQGSGPFATDALPTLETLANLAATAISDERSRRAATTLSTQVADLEAERVRMTERLNYAEAGMLQAARLAAVGQLAASIAHEINNPLYAARNGLYLLEDDLPPEQRGSPYLTLAREQLDRIAGIIGRMRNFYRPSRGEMAAHNLNQLLEETLALAGLNMRDGTIQMVFTPSQTLPEVVCNGDQLRQVFLNLVMNAIEAMPQGGTLTVHTAAGVTLAIVEVQDTGVGIPVSVAERIFEPFFTNKASGTGLGLAISQHIVTQHGGRIEVESQEGQGSIFRVVLPYQPTT